MKQTAKQRLRAQADKDMGDFIRSINQCCQRCKQVKPIEWAHIISRGVKVLRYDVDNALGLCRECHSYLDLNPLQMMLFVDSIRGKGFYEGLKVKSNIPAKANEGFYREVITTIEGIRKCI